MNKRKFLMGIDIGTTKLKAALLDYNCKIIAVEGMDLTLKSPSPGIAEIDPELWWKATKKIIGNIIRKSSITPQQITGIGLSSQGISFTLVDEKGRVLYPAISWLDTRAKNEVDFIRAKFTDKTIYHITGKRINPCYVLPKILWLKRNQKDAFKKTYKFLMSKDYLIFKMTGNFITDHTLAGGTLLYDIKKTDWSDDVLKAFSLPEGLLPEIKWSTESAGSLTTSAASYLGLVPGIPVTVGGQDQKCAAFAAGVGKKRVTISLGTASAITVLLSKPLIDRRQRIPTFPFVIKDRWVFEGVVTTSCANIEWLKGILGFEDKDIEDYLSKSSLMEGLFFYPHLQGSGSPHWNSAQKGIIYGLNLSISKTDIIRSAIEGITFEIRENIETIETIIGKIKDVILFGGGSKNRQWQKIIANVLGKDIIVSETPETAVYGAGILAGLNLGIYNSVPLGEDRVIKYNRLLSREYNLLYKRYRKIEEYLLNGGLS